MMADMCHLRKYLEKRRESNALYETMLSKYLTVDKLHSRGHDLGGIKKGVRPKNPESLTYCGRFCDPRTTEHAAVLRDGNTSSSEQTFRWFSRFKVLLRPMTQGVFNFVVLRLCVRHNARVQRAAKAVAARAKPFAGVPGAVHVGKRA